MSELSMQFSKDFKWSRQTDPAVMSALSQILIRPGNDAEDQQSMIDLIPSRSKGIGVRVRRPGKLNFVSDIGIRLDKPSKRQTEAGKIFEPHGSSRMDRAEHIVVAHLAPAPYPSIVCYTMLRVETLHHLGQTCDLLQARIEKAKQHVRDGSGKSCSWLQQDDTGVSCMFVPLSWVGSAIEATNLLTIPEQTHRPFSYQLLSSSGHNPYAFRESADYVDSLSAAYQAHKTKPGNLLTQAPLMRWEPTEDYAGRHIVDTVGGPSLRHLQMPTRFHPAEDALAESLRQEV